MPHGCLTVVVVANRGDVFVRVFSALDIEARDW